MYVFRSVRSLGPLCAAIVLALHALAAAADTPAEVKKDAEIINFNGFEISVEAGPNPWTNLDFNNNPDNFQFAIVTDRTGGARPGVFEDGVRKTNLLQPEFVMSVGDLIQGGTEDRTQLEAEWKEFNGMIGAFEMPFFYVAGNHDITNAVMSDLWKEKFGRSYYHFKYKDVLFLCLCSEDPPRANISDEQAAYVKKALEENPDVRWTLAFIHQPLWRNAEGPWQKIAPLLEGRKHTVFAGHVHDYAKTVRGDGSRYYTLGTMGGSSQLRGDEFGEFDHVTWVTMTDQGPRITILKLDGIRDEDVRVVD